ncbi:CHAD domain-containing protein [Terrimonas sp. NA20]|uniref:CHAD domain-containing protein n=1 Tax=Terrimonas ginsenosidimutans TaxID=2908004 RepID=A0ABS9KWW0_9BACT|nr:CHAD domain-containing protein [Terrimonas ginsenosidimutans]MCG2616727.1 CHAD domain-containing protein [Terrimonas ginsenosidimutans]
MTRKELLDITNAHYRNMEHHISGMKEMDEEAIHQFRVEYKKLRALFRLLSTLPGIQKEIKPAKKLKQLYSICGKIRDLQLEQQRIRKASANKKQTQAHCTTLERSILTLVPELKKQLDKDPLSASGKKTESLLPAEFSLHDFHRFARLQWTAIKAILRSGISADDHLHTIRKYFKDLYYNLKIYDGAEYRLLHKKILRKMTDSEVKELLDQLGDFQDRSTSLELLKNYWLNSYPINTHLVLDSIQQEWITDREQCFRDLGKKMKTLPLK